MTVIRDEEPRDALPVRRLLEEAFGRQEEAELVEELRQNGGAAISLVAEVDGEVAGHIFFSPMTMVVYL
ncbi:MAG: hypothetical protein GKC10_00880 [Methanosarcinales archaeon]|nr:hypothetical protein [Methanosarcinales archaeon]